MVNQEIIGYIKKSREENLTDEVIKENLEKVGWQKNDVENAFFYLNSPGIPLPPQSGAPIPTNTPTLTTNHSMWDAFEHILLFISMYVFAMATAILMHTYVDYYFPENLFTPSSYRSSISNGIILSSLSAIIVSFPLFAFLFLRITKRTKQNPSLRNLRSRKALIYLTLIVAFLIMLGYLIATVYGFISGNISFNFLLHFGVTVLISGLIFVYYLNEIKEDRRANA
jgi:hypothetical protein